MTELLLDLLGRGGTASDDSAGPRASNQRAHEDGGQELMTIEPALESLDRLVGTWSTQATHPALPGVVAHGTATIEWLQGERFLIHRARTDHPDFPDAISIMGITERDRVDEAPENSPPAGSPSHLSMNYFDSRGVFRVYELNIDSEAWRLWRDAPGFSQRFTGTFADSGDLIAGRWQLCRDDIHWDDDLQVSYRRRS
jgi:hypothetical protein